MIVENAALTFVKLSERLKEAELRIRQLEGKVESLGGHVEPYQPATETVVKKKQLGDHTCTVCLEDVLDGASPVATVALTCGVFINRSSFPIF